MAVESKKPNPWLNIRLGSELKEQWTAYCKEIGKQPSTAVKEAITQQLNKDKIHPLKIYRQSRETVVKESKLRFEVLLTASEKAAIVERAQIEQLSSPSQWIVNSIRAGLTREPQFTQKEVEALGESNYQLLSIGRNLNQIAKILNAGESVPITVKEIEQLRQVINLHVDKVSHTLRASLERWVIE